MSRACECWIRQRLRSSGSIRASRRSKRRRLLRSMSVQSPTSTQTDESFDCAHCGGDRDPATDVAGSFCSLGCLEGHKRAKRAAEVFRLLEQDHRFCATCGRQLKEIELPTDAQLRSIDGYHSKTCVVGLQYRTKHAETGEISLDVDDEADRPIVEDGVATGTVCACGNTSHRHSEEILRGRFPFSTAHWLARAARVLREEDKHDVRLDRETLFDAVLERESIRESFAQAVILE